MNRKLCSTASAAAAAGLFVVLAGSVAMLSGCQRSESQAATEAVAARGPQAPETVAAVKVGSRDIDDNIELTGNVEGYETVELMARIEGYVGEVNVDIGDQVDQGAVLAVLHTPELDNDVAEKQALVEQAQADLGIRQAELEQARAQKVELAATERFKETTHRRVSNLVRSGGLKQESLDEARYALESASAALVRADSEIGTAAAHVESAQARVGVAQAALARARTMLEFATIRAPFPGVVTSRLIDRGAFVRPATAGSGATPLFTMTRADKLRLVVWLPLESAGKLDVGDQAVFGNIPSSPGVNCHGTISRFAMVFKEGSRMMRTEIDLDNPTTSASGKRQLEPGAYGKVTLTLARMTSVPTVPPEALASDADGDCVMVIEQGKLHRRRVEVAYRDAMGIGLSAGVEPGEVVVAKDVARLTDGQLVSMAMAALPVAEKP